MTPEPLAIPIDELTEAIDDTAQCADCLGGNLLVLTDTDPAAPEWHVVVSHDLTCPAYVERHGHAS